MDTTLAVVLVMVFATVALISASIAYVASDATSVKRRRIHEVLAGSSGDVSRADAGDGQSDLVVQKVRTFSPKSFKDMSILQKRLALAGFHDPRVLWAYLAAELALPPVAFFAVVYVFGWRAGFMYAVLAAIVGYLIPGLVLGRYVTLRQKEIRNGLPDALDLLIVSIEAGLAIDQAIMRCADELHVAYPALAEELKYVNVECRAGKPRIEAFKNFASRTKVDDVRSLVAMLVQTDRFGTSIAQALRTHAEVSRTKRRQNAEERAAKIGVKLVFPLVFCLFPAFYVVTLGPAVIKFIHAFSDGGAVGGGVK